MRGRRVAQVMPPSSLYVRSRISLLFDSRPYVTVSYYLKIKEHASSSLTSVHCRAKGGAPGFKVAILGASGV